MDEEAINKVETFISNDISNMIKRWELKDPNLQINKKAFFGLFYKDEPTAFKFSLPDRLRMIEIVNYVRKTIDDPNAGIAYFSPKSVDEKSDRKNNNQIEQYFGFSRKLTNIPQNQM